MRDCVGGKFTIYYKKMLQLSRLSEAHFQGAALWLQSAPNTVSSASFFTNISLKFQMFPLQCNHRRKCLGLCQKLQPNQVCTE